MTENSDTVSLFGIPVVALPGLPPDIVAVVAPGQDPLVLRLPDERNGDHD